MSCGTTCGGVATLLICRCRTRRRSGVICIWSRRPRSLRCPTMPRGATGGPEMSRAHVPVHLWARAAAARVRQARAQGLADAIVEKSDKELIREAIETGKLTVI